MHFIDWFGDGSVAVVDLALACCGVESGAAAWTPDPDARRRPVRPIEELADGARVVLVVSGTVAGALAGRVRAAVESWRARGPVHVVAFGACACAGGPYWDSLPVVDGVTRLGIDVDAWIPGCPPTPEALRAHLDTVRAGAAA